MRHCLMQKMMVKLQTAMEESILFFNYVNLAMLVGRGESLVGRVVLSL